MLKEIIIGVLGTTLFLLALSIMGIFASVNSFNVSDRTVLITGASQGLGLAVARQLAEKGAHVVIVAQTVSKLEKALETIKSAAAKPSQRFLFLSYDLRAKESAAAILEKVTEWNNGIPPDVVFNCAGNCIPGFFASTSLETLRDQMETLYWSCAYLAHATLQAWTQPVTKAEQIAYRGRPRHLIFTSSVAAFLPMAGYAPYTPGKAAMRSLADTLNQEVQVYNGARMVREDGPAAEIKVHAVFPMGILSPGFENEQKLKPILTQKLEEGDKPQQTEDLAKILIAELEAGKYMITASLTGHIMKGWAMGGSQRSGVMDYVWSWIGTLIVPFVSLDHFSKARQWGIEKGITESTK